MRGVLRYWQVLSLVALVAPLIVAWPVLPLQDLPDWVFQAQVVRAKWLGLAESGYQLLEAVPPNALSTVALAVAPSLLSLDVALRLLVLLAAVLIPLGIMRLLRERNARSPAAWWPLLFGFSYPLLHGNLNSALALGAVLLFAAALLEHADAGTPPSWLLAIAAPTFLYVTHGVAYGIWLGLLVLTPLAWPVRARLLAGLVPSVGLALHYAGRRGRGSDTLVSWANDGWLNYKADTLYKQLAPFSSFDPFFLPPWLLWTLAALNYAFVIGVLVLAVANVRSAFRATSVAPSTQAKRAMIAALFVAFVLAPSHVIGLVNPGERLVLPMAVLALSLPSGLAVPRPVQHAGALAVAVIVLAQVAVIGTQGTRAARAMAALLADSAPLSGEVAFIHESHFKAAEIDKRSASQRTQAMLPRHYPLLRAALYGAHGRDQIVPIFETGLLRAENRSLHVRDFAPTHGARNLIVVGEPTRVAAISDRLALSSPELTLVVKRELYRIFSVQR